MAANSLPEAIERACAGLTADGKKFRRDWHVKELAVKILQQRLTENANELAGAGDFDGLLNLIDILSPEGIARLKIFDVTMRVGTYLKIDIERSDWVYLHRDSLTGWQKLTGSQARPHQVPFSSSAAALRVMSHYKIEDFYCEYRLWLHPGLLSIQDRHQWPNRAIGPSRVKPARGVPEELL